MNTVRLKVELRGVEPAVTRVIDVPASSTLPELHDLLQAALGWTDSHLHQFVTAQATYGMPDEDAWEEQREVTDAHLADLGSGFEYLYDFGDGWIHDVEVLGPGGPVPGCVDGHGSCPPEDCGGPSGYAELLEALADSAHPEHERMRSWVGNRMRPFDRDTTDLRVRRAVGEVPESVRLLIDLAADGIKLTPGGRLPRTVVRAMQQHRPHWHPLQQPAATEDNLPPLAMLHAILREVGILRLRHGVLSPTRAAGDDLAIVRRLRALLQQDPFVSETIELTIGVLADHGPLPLRELAAQVYQLLGHGWQLDGQPLGEEDVRTAISRCSLILTGLDLIDHPNWSVVAAGPSALSLLPRASMLAEIWANE